MKNTKQNRKRERGVALMMTLGVLALLMIMAMSFAYSTKTEQLAASVNADMVRSRLLAESGLDRAMSFLREQFRRAPYPGASFYSPSSGDWGDRGGSYLASVNPDATDDIQPALSALLEIGGNWLYYTPEAELHPSVGWIPIMARENPASASSPESCVGLLSYLVIDETGKLDPSTMVDTTYTETSGAGESRVGNNVTEISLDDVPNYYAVLANLFREQSAGGLMPTNGRWLSVDHMARTFAASGITVNQSAMDDYFIPGLRTFARTDNESWKVTTAPPGSVEYHKCDLTAIDWDNTDVGGIPTGLVDFSNSYSTTVGMQYLNDIYSQMNSIDGTGTMRKQFQANIIDYFDTDSAGTVTENDYNAALGTATFVGLEEVPYINEVQVRVKYTNRTIVFLGWIPFWVKTIEVGVRVEFVNLYEQALSVPHFQTLVEVAHAPISVPIPLLVQGGSSVTVGANSYHMSDWETVSFPAYFGLGDPGDVQDVSIVRTRVMAAGGGPPDQSNLYDFADIDTNPATTDLTLAAAGRVVAAEVNDPRLNTSGTGDTDNWAWSTFGNVGSVGTSGAVNGHVSMSGSDVDDETATDPCDVSTAFILNDDPSCLWQLGAIHRAQRWQTINLHSAEPDGTAGTYAYGDWRLLNQAKVTSRLTTRGKVNVFSTVPEVWKAMVQNVRIGSDDYSDPGSGGTAIDETTATSLCTQIAQQNRDRLRNYGDGTGPLAWGPGGLAQLAAVSSISGMDTDATQEELIGKIAGLLSDRHNYFTVLVCARAVKDLGTSVSSLIGTTQEQDSWFEYDTSGGRWCDILGEQKILAEVYRDVYTNAFEVIRFKYLEE